MKKNLDKTQQEQLLEIFSDGQWHSNDQIVAQIGFRFAAILHEIREQGYVIETKRITHSQFEYRLCNQVPLKNAQDVVRQKEPVLNQPQSISDLKSEIPQILAQIPYLKLLVLFGSRARGDNTEFSDWDFAALYDEDIRQQHAQGWKGFELWNVLIHLLKVGDDDIDLVELQQCSPWIAHSIARDGVILFEAEPNIFREKKKNSLKTEEEQKAYRQAVRVKVQATLKRLRA